MNRGYVLILLVLVALAFYEYRSGDDDRDQVRRLSQRDAAITKVPSPPPERWSIESVRGRSEPLPASLVTSLDEKAFWFVGKPGSPCGVEIPFAPGSVAQPPSRTVSHELGGQGADETAGSPVSANLAESTNPGFLGADACRECHRDRHKSFAQTAHYGTSRPASDASIDGSFESPNNRMTTGHPEVHFDMIRRQGRHYQQVSFHGWEFEVPFDIVTGSSKMAQTYLFWHRDRLHQMNVSHLSELDRWANSPGFVDGDAAYARRIGSRCLECHTTFVQAGPSEKQFVAETMIFGVSCERCHGPGRDHVEHHRRHPSDQQPRHIANPADLTRQQRLDVCGQCHSGVTRFKTGPYQFRPGDSLDDHYQPATSKSNGSVHTSNQLSRLSQSECFLNSEMTCGDCHNPHQMERGKSDLFSQRCLQCHQSQQCGMHSRLGSSLADNCIDCHMPQQQGETLWIRSKNEIVFPQLRDHHVRIDAEATEQFLARNPIESPQTSD